MPPGAQFHDRRTNARHVFRDVPYEPKFRDWHAVTGITLHQTACLLGERPERWDAVGCHVGVTRGGKVLYRADFNRIVIHGNGWNNRCVGIEMDGLYEGVAGDPKTLWDDPSTPYREVGMTPTPELVAAACDVVRWICGTVAANGGRVHFLVAHRQSSEDRRDDPGSALWQAVGIPMQQELGLTHGDSLDFRIDSGYPIPHEWDPRCAAKY